MRKTKIACTLGLAPEAMLGGRTVSLLRGRSAASILTAATLAGCLGCRPAGSYAEMPASVRGRERSPQVAGALAVWPGFGAGHYYAGNPGRGVAVLLGEVAGLLLVALPAAGIGNSEGEDLIPVGVALFFGCWLYEIIDAPAAARRHNRRARAFLTPAGGGVAVRF